MKHIPKILAFLCILTLALSVNAQPTHRLYYAGGAILNAADAIVEDGTLSNDNAVFSVLVADVNAAVSPPVVDNWRAAGQLPTTHPTTSALFSWMYVDNAVHIYNGYLYVGPGDWNGDSSRDVADFIAYAPIQSDGTLGEFQLSAEFPGSPDDQAICATALVDFGGGNAYYYVLGGTSTTTNRVIRSKIQPDGSLGAWTVDTPLPNNQWFNRAIVSGTTILHGNGHNLPERKIHSAVPNSSDGSISSWVDRGLYDETSGGRWQYAITTVQSGANKFLVIAGGNSSGGLLADAKIAQLVGDIPGTWTTAAAVPRTFRAAPAVSVANHVIIPGGSSTGGAAGSFADIHIGTVDTAGSITWTTADPMLRAQSFGGAAILELEPPAPTPTPTPPEPTSGSRNWSDYR